MASSGWRIKSQRAEALGPIKRPLDIAHRPGGAAGRCRAWDTIGPELAMPSDSGRCCPGNQGQGIENPHESSRRVNRAIPGGSHWLQPK